MSCKIRELSLDGLADKKAIDRESGEILDRSIFDKFNTDLSSFVKEKYNVGDNKTNLFSVEVDGNKNVVKTDPYLFPILQEAIENFKRDRERLANTDEEIEFTKKIQDLESKYSEPLFKSMEEEIAAKKLRVDDFKKLPEFRDIHDEVEYSILQALDKLDQALARAKAAKAKTEYSKVFQEEIENLIKEMEAAQSKDQWHAILLYVERLGKVVNSVKSNLDKTEVDSVDIFEDIRRFDSYLSTFDMMGEIETLLANARREDLPDTHIKSVKEIQDTLSQFKAKHSALVEDFTAIRDKNIISVIADSKFITSVETVWRNKFQANYKASGITSISKDKYVNQQMEKYTGEIEKDVKKEARKLVMGIGHDISASARMVSDPLNINNKLFQVMVNMIADVREKINERVLNFDFVLDKLHKQIMKEKGHGNTEKLYRHLIQKDADGNQYVMGRYSTDFLNEYNENYKPLQEALFIARDEVLELGGDDTDVANSENVKAAIAAIDAWKKEHLNGRVPADRYKNDISKLSKVDQEIVTTYWDTITQTSGFMDHRASLMSNRFNAKFFKLPSVTKSNAERFHAGDVKGFAKEKIQDLKSVRVDDEMYQKEAVDAKGKELRQLKIHYRGKLDPDQQSIDLLTLMRMEVVNGVNFDERSIVENKLEVLLNVAKEKEYVKMSKDEDKGLFSIFRKRVPRVTVKGIESNLYKKMDGYMESAFYDELHKHAGSIGPMDTNKLVGLVNGTTAFVGMSANLASGVANLTNGMSQLLIESVGGNHLSWKSLVKAEGKYTRELMNGSLLSDLGSPVKHSFTNQVLQMFDSFGGFSVSKHAFVNNTVLKTLATTETLSGLQEGGEHMLTSVLTMAVLDNLKVMNAQREYIDSEGKVVKDKKDAASLLDMLKRDDTGRLRMNEAVAYTDHNLTTKYHEGGKAHINLFIKRKIHDTMGTYDPNFQNELYRAWYGKLLMMFKRFLIPGLQARWKGISYSHIDRDELNESQLMYSTALKEFEEGTYTTFVRTVNAGEFFSELFQGNLLPAFQAVSFGHIKENYNALTDYQRANLRKATTELIITAAVLPALTILATSSLNEDDENEYMWFLAYQLRRLTSELAQYRALDEAWRITTNPIAGTRMIQNALKLSSDIMNPFSWNDTDSKDNLVIVKDLKKVTPIWVQLSKQWKQSYNFINNQAN